MENQHLPKYLRDSAVLNKLSIQQLLQYWAIVCAVAVVLLSLVAVFTNDYISASQDQLANEVIPIEKTSRDLNRTIRKFIFRTNEIVSSVDQKELESHLPRELHETEFVKQVNDLSELVVDLEDGIKITQKLETTFDEFLSDDDAVTNSMTSIHAVQAQLDKTSQAYQKNVSRLRNIIEGMTGQIALDNSRERKRIENDPSYSEMDKEHLLSLFSNQAKLQHTNNNIRQGMVNLELIGREIQHVLDMDELLVLKENRALQEHAMLQGGIDDLRELSREYPVLSKNIDQLGKGLDKLIELLVNSEGSIYHLRLQLLNEKNILGKNIKESDESIKLLLTCSEMLFDVADQFTNSTAISSRKVTRINLFVVVLVSLLVVAIITAGIMLVIYRIDQPLFDLKIAMRDLSNGDMTRRLEASQQVEDEFSELSVDFNRFAERTQLLIDEVSNAKDALEQSDRKTRAILENALVGIANIQGRKFISVNQKFEEIFGFDRNEILDISTEILYPSAKDYNSIGNAAYHLMAQGEVYQGEWQLKRKDGSIFWCDVSAKSIIDNQPDEGTIWLFEDISQRKENEKELRLLANYDTLTGLPNRSLFHDRLEQVLERASRYESVFALMFIDLDRFKNINDSFGHTAGDELLKEVSKRLLACVRGSDTVSRLGGDEFTIIIPDVGTSLATSKVAEKIISVMAEPITLHGQEVIISPSIGISMFPGDAQEFSTILQNADAAMYHAKSEGRNNYQFYTQKMNAEAKEQLVLESRLRHAIEAEEFRLHYHPQVDVASREVIGYEALIRWYVGGEKIVYPGAFISVLEDTGMIVEVGEWVLRTACLEAKRLIAENSNIKHVSVNLSARQFANSDLAEKVGMILEETELPPESLVLEITETVLMTEAQQSQIILDDLHKLGVKLSLDDFGTGYSSLAYLKRFPIDVIKIDQSFVRDIHSDASDAAICEAILAIAHRLDLKVVAEGVETESQFDFLSESQCHAIQGNLFGEPEPIENIIV